MGGQTHLADGEAWCGGEMVHGVGDFGFVDGVGPAAVFVDVGEEADGVEDVGGGEALVVGVLDDIAEAELEIASAQSEKVEGVGVVVDGGTGVEVPEALDGIGAAPLQEGFFDKFAARMLADGAFAGVALERGGAVVFVLLDELISAWLVISSRGSATVGRCELRG